MNIGFKWFQDGAAVPSNWTTIDVLSCECLPINQEVYYSSDGKGNYDGTAFCYKRGRYRISITFGPKCVAANGATVASIIAAQNVMVYDSRNAQFGSINSISFVGNGDVAYIRKSLSNVTTDVTIVLISKMVVI